MPKVLGWFITFNFINVSWVFFRAKEWDDAIKVLTGMMGLNGVVFSEKLYKFEMFRPFIDSHTPFFGSLPFGCSPITVILMIVFLLMMKNTTQLSDTFKPTYRTFFISLILVLYTLFEMSKVSEFLYFNF